jgi:aryl-alcohol dehydrogenase-like predicted oxidoreductase
MDFRERIPFGGTGPAVSRIGVAAGYGVPAAAVEKAFHEYGVNFLWVSAMRRGGMMKAIRALAPRHREELCIALALPAFAGFFLRRFVTSTLRKLRIDHVDLIVLQDVRKPPGRRLSGRMLRLREDGLARLVGISSHERSFLGKHARGEVKAPADFYQVRYNAVHTGAEEDIFAHLPQKNRPGIIAFTATCWRKLLKPKLLPEGEVPPTPADCYRFVLSNPSVDVCLTGVSKESQLEDNLQALAQGPLDEKEMARMRRIGRHIHGTARRSLME